jgi:hypothetical protein
MSPKDEVCMNVILRSQRRNVLVAKFWAPLLCIAASVLVFGEDFLTTRFLLAIPLLIAALFGVSLAILEVRDGVLRYRRLFKWATIPADEIVGARLEWPPVIGSIRLKRFLFPWGRLYFILDKSTESSPFRRGEFPLVRHLNREELHKEGQSSVQSSKSDSSNFRLPLVACIGILTSLMILYLTPGDLLHGSLPKPTSDMPALSKALFHFVGWLHMSVVQVAGLVFMVFLAVRRRDRAEAWLYAFLSGFALTLIAVRLLF